MSDVKATPSLCKKTCTKLTSDIVQSTPRSVFTREWIAALNARPPQTVDIKQDGTGHVTTYISPAGSSDSKMTTLVSVVRDPVSGVSVIVGCAEADILDIDDARDQISSYMKCFDDMDDVKNLPHTVCIESRYGGPVVAKMFWTEVKRVSPNAFEFTSSAPPADGFDPQDIVHGYALAIKGRISSVFALRCDMCTDKVHFHPSPASCGGSSKTRAETRAKTRAKLIEQLAHTHRTWSPQATWRNTSIDSECKQDGVADALFGALSVNREILGKAISVSVSAKAAVAP
jgi:hypothetical protein